MSGAEATRTRAVERLITFSDGVVAVAITLLALPLVDLRPDEGESVASMITSDTGPLVAFLFTFGVVAIMWSAHNRVLNDVRDTDGGLFWINMAWLAAIVLLPWFSALYGESEMLGSGPDWPGAGIPYWGTLALISLLAGALTWYLRRHPQLLLPEAVGRPLGRSAWRSLAFGGYFILIAAATAVAPAAATWLPLGIIPLSIWLRPQRAPKPA